MTVSAPATLRAVVDTHLVQLVPTGGSFPQVDQRIEIEGRHDDSTHRAASACRKGRVRRLAFHVIK